MRTCALVLLIIVAVSFLTRAQTTNSPGAGIGVVTGNPSAAGQAPDDVLAKLAGLIHAGKYPEAQQMVISLLAAYPDDQRLVKAKGLLGKLVNSQSAATALPTPAQAVGTTASNPQPASTSIEQLTGMDLVEYNSLTELGREAQQNTDTDQQKQLLQQFMDQSAAFLQKHPDRILIWQLRAASAMTLDDPMAGYEAGQELLASGQADTDPNSQQLLVQLNLKGWMKKQKVQGQVQLKDTESWCLGVWEVSVSWRGYVYTKQFSNQMLFYFRTPYIYGAFAKNGGTFDTNRSNLRFKIDDSGQRISEQFFLPQNGRWAFAQVSHGRYYPYGWWPVVSMAANQTNSTMTIVVPSQTTSPTSKKPWDYPITMNFTKIRNQQN